MLHNPALNQQNPELYQHPKHKTLPLLPVSLLNLQEVIEQDQRILELEAWQDHPLPGKLLLEGHHQC